MAGSALKIADPSLEAEFRAVIRRAEEKMAASAALIRTDEQRQELARTRASLQRKFISSMTPKKA